jgi:thiosulfate dehydrogenase (quinone) large subunit
LGPLIALGLFTKWSLLAGSLLMALLIFGTALRSDWATPGVQMVYAIVYYLVLSHLRRNELPLDAFFFRKGLRSVDQRHE